MTTTTTSPTHAACTVCTGAFIPQRPGSRICPACREKSKKVRGARWGSVLRVDGGVGRPKYETGAVSLSKTAELVGVCPERVRQIESLALAKLRVALLPAYREIHPDRAAELAKTLPRVPPIKPARPFPPPVTPAQREEIEGLEGLAADYESDAQVEIALEIRKEVNRLKRALGLLPPA